MAKLTYQARKKLPAKSFVFPGKVQKGPRGGKQTHGAFPIPDIAHARNALARAGAKGGAVQAKVRAAVHRKFPGIGKKSRQTSDGYLKGK